MFYAKDDMPISITIIFQRTITSGSNHFITLVVLLTCLLPPIDFVWKQYIFKYLHCTKWFAIEAKPFVWVTLPQYRQNLKLLIWDWNRFLQGEKSKIEMNRYKLL